jgi:4-diphosphocytidyl-2-C-methyl-D-erythritol kinase
MKNEITVLANAKINIHLEVTGKRPNGYHDISSVFQSVSLQDKIEIKITEKAGIMVSSLGTEILGENLVSKAAEKFFALTGIRKGADITLHKNIPLSAGLGGGSADAAAVLSALNIMFDNPLDEKCLVENALTLGADVPFCLFGGTKKAEGLGEVLTDIDSDFNYFVVLIKNFEKQSTGEMYKKVDSAEKGKCVTQKVVEALECGDKAALKKHCRNDFLFVSEKSKEQKEICQNLEEKGAFLAGLSGSGPTVFGFFESEPCESLLKELKGLYKEVYLCSTVSSGFEMIE